MQTLHHNTVKHITKLTKSISNKLFDLLIDLDDQMAHGYENTSLNIMLKYMILQKILYDSNIPHKFKVPTMDDDELTSREILFNKMSDNSVFINMITDTTKLQPKPKTIFNQPIPLTSTFQVAKKYKINIIPTYAHFSDYIYAKVKKLIKAKPKVMNITHTYFDIKPTKRTPYSKINYDEIKDVNFKNIQPEYLKQPFIISKNEFDGTVIKIDESEEQLKKKQQLTKFLGTRSISHRDEDREKYLQKLNKRKMLKEKKELAEKEYMRLGQEIGDYEYALMLQQQEDEDQIHIENQIKENNKNNNNNNSQKQTPNEDSTQQEKLHAEEDKDNNILKIVINPYDDDF